MYEPVNGSTRVYSGHSSYGSGSWQPVYHCSGLTVPSWPRTTTLSSVKHVGDATPPAAPLSAPLPPLPSASPPAAFLQPRQQRLRALMLRSEGRAAGRVQRQWRAHRKGGAEKAGSSAGDEAADYGRVLSQGVARADVLERRGEWRRASETLADAMLHAKRLHDRLISARAAERIQRWARRATVAAAERKRAAAAARVQALARGRAGRLVAMGRRVGTVRLGVIFGGGDASPFRLQLELAPPFTPAFDAPPVFEVAQGLPPPLARGGDET